jgi:hypothetical protein
VLPRFGALEPVGTADATDAEQSLAIGGDDDIPELHAGHEVSDLACLFAEGRRLVWILLGEKPLHGLLDLLACCDLG